jgi:RNA polymerase sigma-70 factor (ECF subfamily)
VNPRDAPVLQLERFRSYLCLLARLGLDAETRAKVDPSDVVQQTLLEAHRSRDLCRGSTVPQQAAWLRRILLQNIVDMQRGLRRAKRDVGRERSLEAALENSSTRLQCWLAAEQPSPSDLASREERVLRLAEALLSLPEAQQEALLLRYCQGLTLVEIGQQLGLKRNAVARLLQRGITTLRESLRCPQ